MSAPVHTSAGVEVLLDDLMERMLASGLVDPSIGCTFDGGVVRIEIEAYLPRPLK